MLKSSYVPHIQKKAYTFLAYGKESLYDYHQGKREKSSYSAKNYARCVKGYGSHQLFYISVEFHETCPPLVPHLMQLNNTNGCIVLYIPTPLRLNPHKGFSDSGIESIKKGPVIKPVPPLYYKQQFNTFYFSSSIQGLNHAFITLYFSPFPLLS